MASADSWIKYKRATAKLWQAIREIKRNNWDSVCCNANDPYILYKIFRKTQNRAGSPPNSQFCLKNTFTIISEARTQSELLEEHFSELDYHAPISFTYGAVANEKLNLPFPQMEVKDAIRRSRTTTPGEVKISTLLFKGMSDHSIQCLIQIYNSVWNSGNIPLAWTSSLILPIPSQENLKQMWLLIVLFL